MKTTYSSLNYDYFIGIDVDKKSYSFTVRDHNTMVTAKRIPSNPEKLYSYINKRFYKKRVLCAYEAGPTGLSLYDYLKDQNVQCLLLSPFLIPKARGQKVKNNRLDSEQISQHLKSGEAIGVRVPTTPYRELRHLIKLRENYAHDRMVSKQRIKSLLLFENLTVKEVTGSWSRLYIHNLKELECSNTTRIHMNMLIEDLTYARDHLAVTLKQIKSFCKEHHEIEKNIEYLQSIPGIGFICAASILGKTGGPDNLNNIQELASFAGLTPSEYSTGDNISRGHITHNSS